MYIGRITKKKSIHIENKGDQNGQEQNELKKNKSKTKKTELNTGARSVTQCEVRCLNSTESLNERKFPICITRCCLCSNNMLH